MKPRRYFVYDVFTDNVMAGNPLAVVADSSGLDDDGMQAIAREFNLSETVFIAPPANPSHTASVRIFMPHGELPFAGHPTVGAAIALAENGLATNSSASIIVLEEKIGNVRCAVSRGQGAAFAEFDLPRLPQQLELAVDSAAIAAALGLAQHEVGFENHRPSLWSAGVPYVTVPVAGLGEAGRAAVDPTLWLDLVPLVGGRSPAPYVYSRDTLGHDCAFHVRMFAPWDGIAEDPATGSAAAAFSGAILHFDRPVDGLQQYWIEQGVEMGRPSRIRLEIDVENGSMAGARIGGHAVKAGEGVLFV